MSSKSKAVEKLTKKMKTLTFSTPFYIINAKKKKTAVVAKRRISWEDLKVKYRRTPFIRKLVNRIANYPYRLGPFGYTFT